MYVVGGGYNFDMVQKDLPNLFVVGIPAHEMVRVRQKLTDALKFTIAVDWCAARMATWLWQPIL